MKHCDDSIYVHDLIEFILRIGDIDNTSMNLEAVEAINFETRVKKKIKEKMDSEYYENQKIDHRIVYGQSSLLLKGKIDGVFSINDSTIVDEVKCVFMNLDNMERPHYLHLAEAKVYAYLYGFENGISNMSFQVTYYNIEKKVFKKFCYVESFLELEKFYNEIICAYEKWHSFKMDWSSTRRKSIKALEFPFSYRKGQKDLVISIYKSILRKKTLFVQAPTGIGKTISTIFPAIKAVGEGIADKIFYLTAKNINRTVAKETLIMLRENGLAYKILILSAKDKICLNDEVDCNPKGCSYAFQHYNVINDALYDILSSENMFTVETICNYAQQYNVCPYFLSMDIATWADIIICDYNYVFAPNAQLKMLSNNRIKDKYLFLIDECHNLVDRGRDMYSASLRREDINRVKKMFKIGYPELAKKLEKCNRYFLKLKKGCRYYRVLYGIEPLHDIIFKLVCEIERVLLDKDLDKLLRRTLREFFFDISKFLFIMEQLDSAYTIYCEVDDKDSFMLKLFCIDTSQRIQNCIDKSISTILFSATLLPINYYKTLLSNRCDDYAIYINSPFENSKRLLLIANDVSTKYSKRCASEYSKIASYIFKVIQSQKGNYMVFVPSFKLMGDIYSCFKEKYPECDIEYIIQNRYMSEIEREEFLNHFRLKKNILGFCVMGGVFSEGIDLKEDALIGVIVVGTGLPQICSERELIKRHYDRISSSGFEYGYLYPAINRVLQASGRVIRTEVDKGIILLLDERFHMSQYNLLFPHEWNDYKYCDQNSISKYLLEFWNSVT